MKFEAYIHTNNSIQVKRVVPWQYGAGIDISSPFVKKYLGSIEVKTMEEAAEKFEVLAKAEGKLV